MAWNKNIERLASDIEMLIGLTGDCPACGARAGEPCRRRGDETMVLTKIDTRGGIARTFPVRAIALADEEV